MQTEPISKITNEKKDKALGTLNENCYEKILSKIDVKQKVIFGSKGSKTCHFVTIFLP